jgi:hypothetical protein
MSFEEISYVLDENCEYEESLEWSEFYGSLEKGSYRIVKTVYYNGENVEFTAEFRVN